MITIIAISYGGSGELPQYLDSLQDQSLGDWRLVIVDNLDSCDDLASLQHTAGRDDRVTLLRPRHNLGYLGGARWAMEELDIDSQWTVISNTDVRLESRVTLAALEQIEHDFPDTSVVAPSIVSTASGRDQNPYLVHRPTVAAAWRRRLMLSHPVLVQCAILASGFRRRVVTARPAVTLPQRIYAPHGSFMAFHRSYFAQGADISYPLFLFGEENYIGEQCWTRHLNVLYAPGIRITHAEHAQTGVRRSATLLQHSVKAARYTYRARREAF
jgi:GT2 family glycosyltransferase